MSKNNRTVIRLRAGSKGAELMKSIMENKIRRREEMKKFFPPKEIMDYVNKKSEDAYNLNEGKLDREAFKLGMLCMWHYMKKEESDE